MDFTERGRDSRFYSSSTGEDNDHRDENSTRRPAFTLTPLSHLPHPSTSSTSSSSPSNWVPSNDDLPGSSGTDNKGTDEEQIIPAADIEKEHMFDKVVTPSDVGKLNRLVIPKQHAEKYFPLDSSTNEKGLLLNFEDGNGKAWRFRYSYWNSSQSYVMTKGWSRFVKEKRLDAGDTVSFGRGIGDAGRDRLFIDWKRRPEALNPPHFPRFPIQNPYGSSMIPLAGSVVPWSRLYTPSAPSLPPMPAAYNHHLHGQSGLGYSTSNPYLYLRSAIGGPSHSQFHPHPHPHPHLAGVQIQYGGRSGDGSGRSSPIVFDSVPIAQPSTTPTSPANSKRFRLFGVNLDCSSISNSTGDPNLQPEGPSLSSSQVRQLLPPPLSLQLGIGGPSSTTTDMVGSPTEDKNQSMSLDLDM